MRQPRLSHLSRNCAVEGMLPIRPNLLAEIQAALGQAVLPSLTSSSAVHDLYEAYLFSLVLKAAETEGGAIELRSIQGSHPSPFVFRTSPGYINSNHRNYGYAVIRFPGCPDLEAHLGIRVSGRSAVLHEFDVAVIFHDEAEVCRNQGTAVAPRSHKVVIAIEAKYYTTDMRLYLGRGFLGLVSDTSAHNAYFVINREARSIERLLAHKKENWEHRYCRERLYLSGDF